MEESGDRGTGSVAATSGPLKLHREGDLFFVTGFGLRIAVKDETEGRRLIQELEEIGYRMCY